MNPSTPNLPLTVDLEDIFVIRDSTNEVVLLAGRGSFASDEALCTLITRAVNAHDVLLALARKYASECGECAGTGLVTIFNHDGHGSDADDQPCPECARTSAL
jgi:hypothetical protein